MEKVKKDDIIKVTVTGVQKYGAFAQSENYDGLIHISEISYGYVKSVNDYLKVGDTYRSVTERLNEWKKYYPNLKKEFEGTAKINEDLFFIPISFWDQYNAYI